MARRYTLAQEEQLKTTILERMQTYTEEIQLCSQELENPDDSTSDEVDVATSSSNRMLLIQRRERLRELKIGLQANLNRIANGTIGICSITQATIPFERMMVVPHATKCVEGKQLDQNRALARKLSVLKEISLSHATAVDDGVDEEQNEDPEVIGRFDGPAMKMKSPRFKKLV